MSRRKTTDAHTDDLLPSKRRSTRRGARRPSTVRAAERQAEDFAQGGPSPTPRGALGGPLPRPLPPVRGARSVGLGSSSRGLPEGVRERLGAEVGYDLSSVSIHTGHAAGAAAAGLSAQAFTTNRSIALARDAPPLESPAGERLLRHEVAHIVQRPEMPASLGRMPLRQEKGTGDRQDGGAGPTAPAPMTFPYPGLTADELARYVDENIVSLGVNLVRGQVDLGLRGMSDTLSVPLAWFDSSTINVLPLLPTFGSRAEAEQHVTTVGAPFKQSGYGPVSFYRQHGFVWPTVLNPETAPRMFSVFPQAMTRAQADAKATADTFTAILFWYVGARMPVRTKSGGGGKTSGPPKGNAPAPKGKAPPAKAPAPAAKPPVAAGATLSKAALETLRHLSGKDAAIMKEAMEAAKAGGSFMDDVGTLAQAVSNNIPAGQVHLIAKHAGKDVFGSLVSGTGIVSINGVTTVVKAEGFVVLRILGPFR